jgi:Ca2+-binding EF-hand superfamily protein
MKIGASDWNTQDASQRQQDLFKKIDQNGDGSISQDELKTFMQSTKAHHHHHHKTDQQDPQQDQQQGTYTQSGTISVPTTTDSKPLGDA